MKTVNLQAAKTHLSRLVDQAVAGEEIVIAKGDVPKVRLVPVDAPVTRRRFGSHPEIPPLPADFDAPLPEDELAARERYGWASRVGGWEIATKHRIGKLDLPVGFVAELRGRSRRRGFRALDITRLHAVRAGSLEGSHREPFDRMIAA